jgi:hypothetical protein
VSALETFQREVQLATSRRVQPVWFRILKWAIAAGISAVFWHAILPLVDLRCARSRLDLASVLAL